MNLYFFAKSDRTFFVYMYYYSMAGILSSNVAQLMMIAGAGALVMHWSQEPTKNSGMLTTAQVSADSDPGDEYAAVEDIKGRDPNAACNVQPPQMLSTSLLPSSGELTDGDFVGITPEKLQGINFLSSGWALGRDTQGNTLRNPSYDLRSEPLNPRLLTVDNNSFSNSTIENYQKRAFEPEAV